MDQATAPAVATKRRRRLRFGLRGLIGLILAVGLILGLIAREDRRVRTQSAVIAELAGMGVRDAGHRPTLLCLVLMKFCSTNSRAIEARFSKWIDPGWFYRVESFNAGRLEEERVPAAARRLVRLGAVKEVQFNEPPLRGLRLFYIDPNGSYNLGVPEASCTFRDHPPATARASQDRPR
jgi:hypothetical protein